MNKSFVFLSFNAMRSLLVTHDRYIGEAANTLLSVYMSLCLPLSLYLSVSLCLYFFFSFCLLVKLCICFSVCLSFCPSVCLSISPYFTAEIADFLCLSNALYQQRYSSLGKDTERMQRPFVKPKRVANSQKLSKLRMEWKNVLKRKEIEIRYDS